MMIRSPILVVAFIATSTSVVFAESGEANPRFIEPPRSMSAQMAPAPVTLPPIVVEGRQATPIPLTAVDRYLLDRSERFRQNGR